MTAVDAEQMPASSRFGRSGFGAILQIVLMAVSVALVLWADLDKGWIGIVTMILILQMLAARIPVGAAMAVPSILGLYALQGVKPLLNSLQTIPFASVSGWTLSVIPMFVFMGLLLWRAGITETMYIAAKLWLNRIPGGLAGTTNLAGTGLCSVSGSTIGIAYALGRLSIPEMLKAGYNKTFALMSVLTSGSVGQLIPPSVLLVVYAGVTQVPVGDQLLAGIVPGLALAGIYQVTIMVTAIVQPSWAPRETTRPSWGERWRSLIPVWPVPALAIVVVGGLYLGIFTATEAGAVGALGSLILTVVFLRSPRKIGSAVGQALKGTVASTGSIFLVLLGATFLNRLIALSGLAADMVRGLEAMDLQLWQFLVLLAIIFLLLGTFLEGMTLILLPVPILLPILNQMEINLVWFGIFLVLLVELATLSPPVGLLVFVIYKISQDPEVNQGHKISLNTVFNAAMLAMPPAILLLLAISLMPDIVMWLPLSSK